MIAWLIAEMLVLMGTPVVQAAVTQDVDVMPKKPVISAEGIVNLRQQAKN